MIQPSPDTVICPRCYRPGDLRVDGSMYGRIFAESRWREIPTEQLIGQFQEFLVIHEDLPNNYTEFHRLNPREAGYAIEQFRGRGAGIDNNTNTHYKLGLIGAHVAMQHYESDHGPIIALIADSGEHRAIVMMTPDNARELARQLTAIAAEAISPTGMEPGLGSTRREEE